MGELIGTSATDRAIRFTFQRKSFYAAGRFWVFYCDGINNMVYRTSTDGITWEEPINIRTCGRGSEFSIWFDGIYLHYAYSTIRTAEIGYPLFYRRGIPEEGGTITWSTGAEQIAVAGAVGIQYQMPCVSVDSNGSAWIGYLIYDYPTNQAYVTKSSTTTGIWVTDVGAGFPFPLSTPTSYREPTGSSIIPLTGGEMLAIYARYHIRVNARLWNGVAWGGEISTINNSGTYVRFCAVAEGNDVHLVFISAHRDLIYVKYDYSSNSFTVEKNLLTGTLTQASPVISIDEDNNLLVFWANYPMPNTLYYMRYTAENDTWGPVVKWKAEETELRSNSLTCFYRQYSGYTGLAYTMFAPPGPYAVKFNYIAPLPPGVTPEPGEPGSPGAPEPTPEPEVVSNTLTASGSRHTTPEQGSVGTSLRTKRGRLIRHITWVPVIITRA